MCIYSINRSIIYFPLIYVSPVFHYIFSIFVVLTRASPVINCIVKCSLCYFNVLFTSNVSPSPLLSYR